MDRVRFRVVDNNVPPNQSSDQEFVVKVMPVDDQPPYLVLTSQLKMTVDEFNMSPFSRAVLQYTDDDTIDRNLKFTVTKGPYDSDTSSPLGAGKLVLTDDPNTEVTMFTQGEVTHLKISYLPPDVEMGVTQRAIQFIFDVEDTNGNVAPDQVFTIFLKPINDKPPTIKNTGTTVLENGFIFLTTDVLDADDEDSNIDSIIFTIVTPPTNGVLQLGPDELGVGDTFTRKDIVDGQVVYKNTGVEMDGDKIVLDVTDGIHHIPVEFKIRVHSIDDEAPTLVDMPEGTLGAYLEVDEGKSAVISSDILKADDLDTDPMKLTFIVDTPPGKGVITRDGVPTNSFSQEELVNGRIAYQHTGGEIGKEIQSDIFNLTLSDMSNEWVIGGNSVQAIDIFVTINPVDNTPPVVTVGPGSDEPGKPGGSGQPGSGGQGGQGVFTVAEAGRAPLEQKFIDVTDDDTPIEDLMCMIVVQPELGYIENTSPAPGSEKSRMGMWVSSFTMADILNGNVNYHQSIHQGIEPIEDRFTFRCTDGVNQSPNFIFPIRITPTNDEAPEIAAREFIVMEGMNLMIDTPILNADDKDVPADDLLFEIIERPKHGDIIRQTPSGGQQVETFTLEDITSSSNIVYEHDDSETTRDSFKVRVTDGKFSSEKTIMIIVIPVDDETPRLTINNGLEVKRDEAKVITNNDLKATDLDTNDATLEFVVRREPKFGVLQMVVGSVVRNLTRGQNFTQFDIDTGRIRYLDKGKGGYRDLIKFDITDGTNPLIDRYFFVTLEGLDLIYPEVLNQGVNLPEGGSVTLTTDIMSTSDLNTPDENLRFTLTKPPSRGHLESTDNPGIPITTFTQLELAGNKIKYVHTSNDEVKMDNFEFEVSDGFNSVFQTFRISLSGVDNKKPVLMFAPLKVKEGGSRLITPFELKAVDQDTPDESIIFQVTKLPTKGQLQLEGSNGPVTSFTMMDLHENRLSYVHDGSESTADSFSFLLTDGTHNDFFVYPNTQSTTSAAQTVKIQIIAVDNGMPTIESNKGAENLAVDDDGLYGVVIGSDFLKVTDKDTPSKDLKYKVTKPPKNGYIVVLGEQNGSQLNWTQEHIDKGLIKYFLKKDINATDDSFTFDVTDKGGNVLSSQTFSLSWAMIYFDKDSYTFDESDSIIEVVLRRRGSLRETAFISIAPTDASTATEGEDFGGRLAKQVQFNPGENAKTWSMRLLDDDKYEDLETIVLELSEPVEALLGMPSKTTLTIKDAAKDQSRVFIPETGYKVDEDAGTIKIPIKRTGDLSDEFMVICFTESDTAKGTVPRTVTSYSDYITRPEDHTSAVRFDRYEAQKYCTIKIIDDSLYEPEEKFKVKLSTPMGGILGGVNETTITINADSRDEPVFEFEGAEYLVDESAKYLEVTILRTGTDLSKSGSVVVRTRKSSPISAQPGIDYIPIYTPLVYGPNEVSQKARVTIVDDLVFPSIEGDETFELVLRMPEDGGLGDPSEVTVTISDKTSDVPRFEFRDLKLKVTEGANATISATIVRQGDINHEASVRCFTRQGSATVMIDYDERPDTDASKVTFAKGEKYKPCVVNLLNDTLYEGLETLRLVLGSAESASAGGAAVGVRNVTSVEITDNEDKPYIGFVKKRYMVKEPRKEGSLILKVPVVRRGDVSKESIVRVYSRDGSAKSGTDYIGFSDDLVFGANVSEIVLDVEISYDGKREMNEAFSIQLQRDRNNVASLGLVRTTVYIEEMSLMADVTFPTRPMVLSLRDYDNIENRDDEPVPGYPLVCLTPCNPRHPDFSKTGSLCDRQNINDTMTEFRWRVAAPDNFGISSRMKDVTHRTFMTRTDSITLDSIYFAPGSRVSCGARAVSNEGNPGLELLSAPVTIAQDNGICMPRIMGSFGAEPFSAKIKYTGAEDGAENANKIKLTVTVPHRDGMLPAISTNVLSNFDLTLSPNTFRLGLHRCSNLLDFNEVKTESGFITNGTASNGVEVEPYQYDNELRGDKTLRFYKNLNLETCMWTFTAYFTMSELIVDCGGSIGTDGQVKNDVQSYVMIRVPLFVSYVFHSPAAPGGWLHFDLESELRLSFVYDTAILWQDGINSVPGSADDGVNGGASGLKGQMYPTSMRIGKDGRLIVNFRTNALFRGQFVLNHEGTSLQSIISSPDNPDLTFTLQLIRGDPTYNQPEQFWEFVSDYAVRDYSGMYKIQLLPCTTAEAVAYALPLKCTPRMPILFDLEIRFQQVSDPVPTEYSLNTQFHLIKSEDLWLSDGQNGFEQDQDSSFSLADIIRARIMVDPVQSLGSSFKLDIEKVFLCTGKDGYIPKYNPENSEYGCIANSDKLAHAFRLLDRNAPNTEEKEFRSIPFNARLASDDPTGVTLKAQPGNDGFSMDARPLFEVDAGRQWFIHSIYSVRSQKTKRSIRHHILSSSAKFSRTKRALEETKNIGKPGTGTNMALVALNYTVPKSSFSVFTGVSSEGGNSILPIILGIVACVIIAGVIVGVVIFIRRRKRQPPVPKESNMVTLVTINNAKAAQPGPNDRLLENDL
ncbi:FRAS1-related extracellular matrix protein 2-like [Lineus longissimus]|uniref:FRAS1-related extracellular matrix protein 2-like n=1 Tax=Lineus longissimus TaxID=88925 RepID=UPI00315D0218